MMRLEDPPGNSGKRGGVEDLQRLLRRVGPRSITSAIERGPRARSSGWFQGRGEASLSRLGRQCDEDVVFVVFGIEG